MTALPLTAGSNRIDNLLTFNKGLKDTTVSITHASSEPHIGATPFPHCCQFKANHQTVKQLCAPD